MEDRPKFCDRHTSPLEVKSTMFHYVESCQALCLFSISEYARMMLYLVLGSSHETGCLCIYFRNVSFHSLWEPATNALRNSGHMEKAHAGTFLIAQAKLPTSTTSSTTQVPDIYKKNPGKWILQL